MRFILACGMAMLPFLGNACDVCGIFLGVQPHDRTTSYSLLWRFRHLEGTIPNLSKALPKHGGHSGAIASASARSHYRELYQVAELRGDIWWGQRFATLVSLPLVNNYRAVDGIISNDVYGLGDPLIIGRYLLVNTRCTTTEERTVHRLMLGGGAKFPLGAHDLTYNDREVDHDQQPGTGSWDWLASAEYMVRRGRNGASFTAIGRWNGADSEAHRMGHGLSTTVDLFRRWDLGENWKVMPSLGAYHELSGKDVIDGVTDDGTGGSTLFASAGTRVWWRSIGLQVIFQRAVAHDLGDEMIPNKERMVLGLTYNIVK